MFKLHPQLEKDCLLVGEYPLCRLLLVNDDNYPWFILVPRRADVSEVFQLSEEDQLQLMKESNGLSALLAEHFQADKLNVAALGNMVPQLHIHHIVRYKNDIAWPKPVWGVVPAEPYSDESLKRRLADLLPKLVEQGREFER